MENDFLLNPEITFLNFGSFGACPKPVYNTYQDFQRQLEYEPVQFMAHHGPRLLKQSRQALSAYIGCHEDDVVFVPNPTHAFNIVAKNLRLQDGDEVLTTDIEYGAMDRTWHYYAAQKGFAYKRQHIELPLKSVDDFCEKFWRGLTPKTKAIHISHITSSTALILPVKQICQRANELGLITIVDGAHVPGHIPLHLQDLQVDYYTGACHKWMMTPKGCSFLYARKELQHALDPLIVGWGYQSTTPSHSQFLDYHQVQGTRDYSAYLTVPAAIGYMQENKWSVVAAGCRQMVQQNVQRFADLLQTTPLAPIGDDFFGQMCSLEVKGHDPIALKQKLYNEYRIEIPVMPHEGKVYIRYSINVFNTQDDLDELYEALQKILIPS
ncbi:MAG: aminotransferase class V-fold PLP-dependent enzyme [Flavobacteriales bacterium]